MSYRVWMLLLLLSTNCHSQERGRPRDSDKSTEFNPESQLMRSLSQPPSVLAYSAPGTPAVMSVEELQLPLKAARELKRSTKAYQSGDWRGSATHLEKVLDIAPQYWPAHAALGRVYVRLHEYDRAVGEFKQASVGEPRSAEPLNNLSETLFLLQRYPEAESVARRSVEVDPSQVVARYILGCALLAQGRVTTEALEQLRLSTSQIPTARLVLADVFCRRGAVAEAAAELRSYLEVVDAPEKKQVQSWLAQLTRNAVIGH